MMWMMWSGWNTSLVWFGRTSTPHVSVAIAATALSWSQPTAAILLFPGASPPALVSPPASLAHLGQLSGPYE